MEQCAKKSVRDDYVRPFCQLVDEIPSNSDISHPPSSFQGPTAAGRSRCRVAVCCSVLPCVAVCCSVLQCVAVCGSVLQCAAVCCSVLPCVAVCFSVLQCVAVCVRAYQMSKCAFVSGSEKDKASEQVRERKSCCSCGCGCSCVAARHCNTRQHMATRQTLERFEVTDSHTHCNTLQRTATHCNTRQHTATHGNTRQHTATHGNALQHTATYCNTV